jgi:hypothetical protein
MKVIRTIGGHLRLLTRLMALRLRQNKKGRALLKEDYTPAVKMAATYPTPSTKQERT